MSGRYFKRCGCRGEDKKQLGNDCPKLGQKNHGSWTFVVDIPTTDGKRKQVTRGGFRRKVDAEDRCAEIVGLTKTGHQIDDKIAVGAWLDLWLKEKTDPGGISSAGRTLRHSTEVSYRYQIDHLLKPHLGMIKLTALTAEDISATYRKIMSDAAAKVAEETERLRIVNESRVADGLPPKPIKVKVPGPTTLARTHSCLRAALNAAVKSRRIPYNPAMGVELPTPEKVPVKPWEAVELGRFLDSVQNHRLGPLFEVVASCGLRRGEALGLQWSDVDVEAGTITIRRQLLNEWSADGPVFGPPKSASGQRVVELDSGTLGTLLGHRLRQDEERNAWSSGYEDHGLVFAQENGRPYDPNRITKLFGELSDEAELRRIRFHDLRHGAASLMLAAGIPIEIVSKRLGHSTIGVTHDVYSHLLGGVGRQAAEQAMGLVPRAPKDPQPEPLRDHNVSTSP